MEEDKKTKDQKINKKTRGFLKSVGLAVTAVLTATPFINQGVSEAVVISSIKKSESTAITQPVEQHTGFIIQPSNPAQNIGNIAAHQSHSSHVSHQSHSSHRSHYSSSV